MSGQKVTAIHPTVDEIIQSGPKWWIDQPTDQHCYPYSMAYNRELENGEAGNTN